MPGLRRAVGAAFGLDEPALVAAAGVRRRRRAVPELLRALPRPVARARATSSTASRRRRWRCWTRSAARDWRAERRAGASAERARPRRRRGRARAALRRRRGRAAHPAARPTSSTTCSPRCSGRHVPAGPVGQPDARPRRRAPDRAATSTRSTRARCPPSSRGRSGCRLADALLDRYRERDGRAPAHGRARRLGHGGDAHPGRRRGRDPRAARRAADLAPRVAPRHRPRGRSRWPSSGGPRIDVTVRISGFFRDAFPHLVVLLDDAVALVAGARRAGRATTTWPRTRAPTPSGWRPSSASAAWRRATTRVFGSKPGTYGAGLLQLVDARDWRDDADLAAGLRGLGRLRLRPRARRRAAPATRCATASGASRSRSRTSTTASTTSSTPTTTTSTTAAWSRPCARSPAASPPPTWATAPTPRAWSRARLAEETRRVFRARVANPRWIASMIRHGYKGASELSATVDYLFGYDATTGVAEDWMYEQVAAALPARRRRRRVHDALQPVGGARHRRAAARGGRPRAVGGARRRHAGATSATATSRSRASWRRPAREHRRTRSPRSSARRR